MSFGYAYDDNAPPRSEAPTPLARRKPHRKSRTGCAECRRRRIKCTEERPSCLSCIRRDAQCQYPGVASTARRPEQDGQSRPSLQPSQRSAFQQAAPPVAELTEIQTVSPAPPWTDSLPLPLPSLPRRDPSSVAGSSQECRCTSTCTCASSMPMEGGFEFEMDDLVLLHHWTLFASRDIYNSPSVDYCWQTVLPRIAFHNPFVMHGILSLSALHLAHTDHSRGQDRTLDASRHHNVSLQGFRIAINHITDDNSDALFAFSLLNVIYIFAMLGSADSGVDGPKSRIARVLGNEWIPTIRGVQAVLQPVYDRVRLGPLGPLTKLDNWDELDVDSASHPDDDSFRRVSETWTDIPDASLYDEALLALRKCRLYIVQFQNMDQESLRKCSYNQSWAGPLLFIYTAPEAYFTKLHQRQPQALVLFAYFGALLHGLNSFWFLEGWGRDVVQVTDEILGDFWRPWMSWPREVVGLT